MNTITAPGNGDKNGRVQAWIDGEPVLDVDTLRLRDYDTVKVDKFYLSTFHGGSSTEWAPTHDCFIRYDNFTVSTDSIAIAINAATDTNSTEPDTSGTTRIMTRSQNHTAATPVKIYRIDGTLIGRKETRPDATTHQLKNGKRVKVVR